MAAHTFHSRGMVVIGTSESGPRKFNLVDDYHMLRPDDPAPEVGFPPSKPGPARIEQDKSDAEASNHWVTRAGADILP